MTYSDETQTQSQSQPAQAENCLGGKKCIEGYAGLSCSECADGFYTAAGKCNKCSSNVVKTLLLVGACAGFAGGVFLVLKKITSLCGKPNFALTFFYVLSLALGIGSVGLSVYYLSSADGSTSFSMANKIFFCVVLTLSQMGISLVAVDALGQLVLFYIPARCMLKRYEGSAAHPRERDQEMARPTMFSKVMISSAAAAADSVGSVASSDAPSALEVASSAAAAVATELALDAATLEALRKLQPNLEPIAVKRGVTWEQVKAAAMEASAAQLEEAIDDPAAFLERLLPSIKELAVLNSVAIEVDGEQQAEQELSSAKTGAAPDADLEANINVEMSSEISITIDAGPLGIGIIDKGGLVMVSSVDADSAAEKKCVRVGMTVMSLNGASMHGLNRIDVTKRVQAASRPFTLKVVQAS